MPPSNNPGWAMMRWAAAISLSMIGAAVFWDDLEIVWAEVFSPKAHARGKFSTLLLVAPIYRAKCPEYNEYKTGTEYFVQGAMICVYKDTQIGVIILPTGKPLVVVESVEELYLKTLAYLQSISPDPLKRCRNGEMGKVWINKRELCLFSACSEDQPFCPGNFMLRKSNQVQDYQSLLEAQLRGFPSVPR
ncbi:MAG: hypothetical protein Q8R08_00840 [bacterium]|nr:hypothetical protein [bacterium]